MPNTDKKGQTKRHHYVPQMILRNFSANEATTSLVVLSSGKRVPEAPINRQCYEPYFYGEDQVMERSFSREEANVSKVLGDLSRERLDALTDNDIALLKNFVHYQRARTRAAAESVSNFAEAFAKSILRGTAKLNTDNELAEAVENVKIRLGGTQHESIWQAGKSTPLMWDMDVRFLVTSRDEGFVIGDHPVVAYNQFAEHHPVLRSFPTSTGLAAKGLQLFMPLSPSVTLACFDPSTYQYDGKRVCGAGPRDVRFLNAMQAVNAWECLFFDAKRTADSSIQGMLERRQQHASVFEKRIATSEMRWKGEKTVSQFVAVSNPDVRVGARLSFLRGIDRNAYGDYEGATVLIRSVALLEFTQRYGVQVEQEAKRQQAGETVAPESADDTSLPQLTPASR